MVDWRWMLQGEAAPGLPVFCLERWQSLHETRVEVVLSESGVEPPGWDELGELLGVDPLELLRSVDLGYGWTKGLPLLRERVASLYPGSGVAAEHVVLATGSAEANLLTVLALVAPGDTVIVDMPSYMQVRGLLELRGARVVEVWRSPGEGWRLPLERLASLVEELRPRAVFVNNPNNPTGDVARSLRLLAEAAARRGTLLVFDEVYRGLELEGETPSVLVEAASWSAEAVSVSGLSKSYGLPGLRIGWAAASSQGVAERLWSVKDYTTISTSRLGEALAAAALEPEARGRLLRRAQGIVRRNLELAKRLLAGLLDIHEPRAGAYIWARVPGSPSTIRLAEELLEKGILVNPGECFRMPGWLRIGLGTADPDRARSQYERLAEELRALLAAGSS